MLGEKAVLVSVTPISSAIEENLFLKISNKIGFTFTVHSSAPFRAVTGGCIQNPTPYPRLGSMESWSIGVMEYW
jgi:hypothetical protein